MNRNPGPPSGEESPEPSAGREPFAEDSPGPVPSTDRASSPADEPTGLVDYDWAVLRVVPRVHLGACVNVAVVLHARRAGFLGMRALSDEAHLRERVPGLDARLILRYLQAFEAVCRGEEDPTAGHAAVGLAPPSERFHWLTAPRSDVLQSSPVHGGLTLDPTEALERLYREQVDPSAPLPGAVATPPGDR